MIDKNDRLVVVTPAKNNISLTELGMFPALE